MNEIFLFIFFIPAWIIKTIGCLIQDLYFLVKDDWEDFKREAKMVNFTDEEGEVNE